MNLLKTSATLFSIAITDGDRAHVSIFYNKDRFTVKKSGYFWLSETPEKPSYDWGASSNRNCTWAEFYDNYSKKIFYVFNTHLDHVGEVSRVKSAELLKRKISGIAGNAPVVLTGDMNSSPGSEPINIFRSFLSDSKDISQKPHEGSYGTFNHGKFNFVSKNPIDFIFVNKSFSVSGHRTINDSENGFIHQIITRF